jgi:hypothetical protein
MNAKSLSIEVASSYLKSSKKNFQMLQTRIEFFELMVLLVKGNITNFL